MRAELAATSKTKMELFFWLCGAEGGILVFAQKGSFQFFAAGQFLLFVC
jgi:hypothetical protein